MNCKGALVNKKAPGCIQQHLRGSLSVAIPSQERGSRYGIVRTDGSRRQGCSLCMDAAPTASGRALDPIIAQAFCLSRPGVNNVFALINVGTTFKGWSVNTGDSPATILKYYAKLPEVVMRKFVENKPGIPNERV